MSKAPALLQVAGSPFHRSGLR